MTLLATHYFELTQLEKNIPGVVNVHVSAADSSSKLVFLHEILEGPASKSYGIAVAKLAGIPKSVIRTAQRLQRMLEEKAAQTDEPQLDLFFDSRREESFEEKKEVPAEAEKSDELKNTLLSLDLDELSPKQAWEELYKLQKQAEQD